MELISFMTCAQNEEALGALQLMFSNDTTRFAANRDTLDLAAGCQTPSVCDNYFRNIFFGASPCRVLDLIMNSYLPHLLIRNTYTVMQLQR